MDILGQIWISEEFSIDEVGEDHVENWKGLGIQGSKYFMPGVLLQL